MFRHRFQLTRVGACDRTQGRRPDNQPGHMQKKNRTDLQTFVGGPIAGVRLPVNSKSPHGDWPVSLKPLPPWTAPEYRQTQLIMTLVIILATLHSRTESVTSPSVRR